VAELRGAGDEPDDGDAPARRSQADAGDATHAARPRNELRPRAEYAAVLKAQLDSKAQSQHDANQEAAAQETPNPETADQEAADPKVAHAEAPDPKAELSVPDALQRFEPSRAGLPEVSHADAATYIDEHEADRPWLAQARDCSPGAQRVIVALDQGHGHAHIRHEGWVTEEMNERRVRNLEDPAQLEQDKRGIDGLVAGDLPHRCGDTASRITNPEIFAAAFARGVEHPDVRAALESNGPRPEAIILPISSVLGDDGHKFCSGWRLESVNRSTDEARANRRAWVAGDRSGPEPRAQPVESFEGGTVTFAFRRSPIGGYEISTMYVNPPDGQPT
jgi:hypothetical protein